MSILGRVSTALKELKKATYNDGLKCHCDPDVGAVPCEICGDRELLRDIKIEIEQLQLGICSAIHLLKAATGPEGLGPTSWRETRQKWLEEFEALDNKLLGCEVTSLRSSCFNIIGTKSERLKQ